MINLDVTNLYPAINLKEMTPKINDTVKNHGYETHYGYHYYYMDPKIINTIQNTTNLILNVNYFKLKNKIYRELKEVPMVFPISHVIADSKLRKLEETIINDHKKRNTPMDQICRRYFC